MYAQCPGKMDEAVRLLDTALQLDRIWGLDVSVYLERKRQLSELRARIEANSGQVLAEARMHARLGLFAASPERPAFASP